jgi:hypothetical protein
MRELKQNPQLIRYSHMGLSASKKTLWQKIPGQKFLGKSFWERQTLRNDIRRDLVFDEGDAVAQLQLAFLQPLQPQQIRRGRLMQGIDRRVEIAVLLLQSCKLGCELALILVGHGA